MFYELVDAIRGINSGARFFCVGDDWQAINAFAGSELRFYEGFEECFGDVVRREIPTNYRSAGSVVEAGNAPMRGKGTPARPSRKDAGVLLLKDLNWLRLSDFEDEWYEGEKTTAATLRIVRYLLDRGLDVTILSRTNTVDGFYRQNNNISNFLRHVRSFLPETDRRRVNISTTHRYKGREQEAVIILDAFNNRYPLIHPSWVFLRIFGENPDSIEQEERRLFYVALTRAKESLVILTDSIRQSPYIADIGSGVAQGMLSGAMGGFESMWAWEDMPPVPPINRERMLTIRVSKAYEVREQLKYHGYHFEYVGRYWHRVVPAQGFSFDSLCEQPWAPGRTIRVYSDDDTLEYEWPA